MSYDEDDDRPACEDCGRLIPREEFDRYSGLCATCDMNDEVQNLMDRDKGDS